MIGAVLVLAAVFASRGGVKGSRTSGGRDGGSGGSGGRYARVEQQSRQQTQAAGRQQRAALV